ncbi:MAG: nucleotidyltransferase domain-containing protein [Candidatus Poribacteria bacterium]|nr:nucleotidyltransferase domain-containing protein [Candidatus Poribacteria bacterium]
MTTTSPPIFPRAIHEMSQRIVAKFHPTRVLLFGAYARGDATANSDVELLVVMPDETDTRQTDLAIRRLLKGGSLPKNVVVTTPEELERRGKMFGSVLREALDEGVTLYSDGSAELEALNAEADQ